MSRQITFLLMLSITLVVYARPNIFSNGTIEILNVAGDSEETLTSTPPDFSNDPGMTCADKCTDFYMAMIKNHPEFDVERLRDESLACIRRCRFDQ